MDPVKFLEKFETSSVDTLVELSFLLYHHNVSLRIFYLAQNKELKQELINSSWNPIQEIKMCFTDTFECLNPVKLAESKED